MKRVLMSLLIAAVVILIAFPLSAKTFTATRLGDVTVIPTQPAERPACVVGNLEQPAWAVTGWVIGNEA